MNSIFKELIQNIPAIFYRCKCDKEWTMLFINDAVEKITGFPASDFINNKVRSYGSIIHPDDSQRVENAVLIGTQAHEPWSIEYRLLTCKNEERWVMEMGIAVYNKQGGVDYLDGFIQDISDSKEMELALISAIASEKRFAR